MTNKDIAILATGGFLSASAHCLPSEHFYKWHRFRKYINLAYNNLMQQEKDLLEECEITDATKASPEKIIRFNETYRRVQEENVDIPSSDRIPFEFYKRIYDENKTDKRDVFADIAVETLVLDYLFEEPK